MYHSIDNTRRTRVAVRTPSAFLGPWWMLLYLVVFLATCSIAHAGQFTPTWHLPTGVRSTTPMRRVTASAPFVGHWANADRATQGITRLEITRSGNTYRVHAWGKCLPRDCDWGSVTAAAFGSSVRSPNPVVLKAVFSQSTSEQTLVLRQQGAQISAELLTQFRAARAAGRANYAASYRFVATQGTSTAQTTTPTQSPAPSAPAAKGRFRVVITGFTVNHETYDDMLQRDGKGDEVYVYTNIVTLNRSGKRVDEFNLRTRTMGDTNGWPDRLRAGTRSARGGLESGDQYPSSNPWRYSGRTYTDRLPELVWHGELAQGGNTVVITPTIWEWDKTGEDLWSQASVVPEAILQIGQLIVDYPSDVAGAFASIFGGGANTPATAPKNYPGCIKGPNLDAQKIGVAETRPIGMKMLGGAYRYCPQAMVLNYAKAAQIAQTSQGFGKGVVRVTYKDSAHLGSGSYTLYVNVQKY